MKVEKICGNVPLEKIVITDSIKKYFRKDMEIRLEYISAICGNLVIPIYYYNHKQTGFHSFNDLDMTLDVITGIDKEIVVQKLEELRSIGFNPTKLSYYDNLHTHPVGITSFSPTDYAGCLKPDYDIEKHDILGSNMLFDFNGKFYRAVSRTREKGKDSKYEYRDLEAVYLECFNPHIDINMSLFSKGKTRPFIHNAFQEIRKAFDLEEFKKQYPHWF
jgi:hypothetical protein